MKIVLAPDKFKNSLTGMEFCQAVEDGIHALNPDVDILKLPLADGGDGTIEVVNYYLKGDVVEVDVSNPFFEPIKANYLYAETSRTAFIEMAEASGLKLLKRKEFDCKNATTLGTGDMILDALNKGAQTIILGIGGSATNDCGIGMATALGYRFLDERGKEVIPTGINLSNITSIDVTNVHPNIGSVKFKIACDVTNPLYGENGAAHIYANQKGAKARDIIMLDNGLKSFSKIINEVFGVDAQTIQGAGAAGGMGIASKVFLNGTLERGIQLIKDLAGFDDKLEQADWIITGEGKLDTQTMSGKTILGVLSSAKAKKIKVAAFCGTIDLEGQLATDFGIEYTDAVVNYSKNLNDAMRNSKTYVEKMAQKFTERL